MRAGQELLKEEMPAKVEAKTDDNHAYNKKFQVLRSILISRVYIHQAWTEAMQENLAEKPKIHHERLMARTGSQLTENGSSSRKDGGQGKSRINRVRSRA
jgi:hypothetical protein